MVNHVVDNYVVAFRALGEILFGVINDVIGAERSNKIDIARATDAGHIRTKCLGNLHRERAHASGSAVDQDLLARLHICLVAHSLQCRHPRYIDRSCLLECQVGRFQRQRARRTRTNIFGKRAASSAEHFITGFKLRDVLAHGFVLSIVDSRNYLTQSLQPTAALREEARRAAETALTLQPNLGEAVLAKGTYHYCCLKDYDTAVRYFEQARQLLPNSSSIPEWLAYVARRRGQWDRSEAYFIEAERLDPRNVSLLFQSATNDICHRHFRKAQQKFDKALDITPDDLNILVQKASIAQAEGHLPRASALLAQLHFAADDLEGLETQVYQAILERRPTTVIPHLKEILA